MKRHSLASNLTCFKDITIAIGLCSRLFWRVIGLRFGERLFILIKFISMAGAAVLLKPKHN